MNIFFKYAAVLGLLFNVFSADAMVVKKVYRADSREPKDVFVNGFRAWGTNTNFNDHIYGRSGRNGSRDSAFIPTTVNLGAAEGFAADLLRISPTQTSYVYNIRATENFYYATETINDIYSAFRVRVSQGLSQTLAREQEYSALAYITAEQIESVSIHQRQRDGSIVVTQERNPNYRAGDTHSSDLPFRQGEQTVRPTGEVLLMGASMTNTNNEQPNNSAWLPYPPYTQSTSENTVANYNCFCF